MFKSTKNFKNAIYNILVDVNNGITLDKIKEKYDSQEFDDALEECINRNYILGIRDSYRAVTGTLIYSLQDTIRLSCSGLDFIEKFKIE